VEIYRRLASDDPAAYDPDLARSLTNLGTQLAAFDPDLARSLTNLGTQLAEVGQRAQALATTEQAVEIYRRLASDDPAAYDPDLARSLHAWAWVRCEAWQELSRALQATGEAVELYRKLVAVMPARFASPLRPVLRLQVNLLISLGRLREAGEVRDWLAANALILDSHN